MSAVPITRVTGGVGGLAATYAHVRALADHFDSAGDRAKGFEVRLTDDTLIGKGTRLP